VTAELVLLSHTDIEDALGFLPSWHAAKGGQAQGNARCVLGLAHPVVFPYPEQRCDRIGTDRQADWIEPSGCSGFELVIEIACQLLA